LSPFHDGFRGAEGVQLSVNEPPVPSSLPMVGHRLSASTSFVLASLRALHVDPCGVVTGSAMIEEGASPPRPCTWVTRTGGLFRFGSCETNRIREDQAHACHNSIQAPHRPLWGRRDQRNALFWDDRGSSTALPSLFGGDRAFGRRKPGPLGPG
jgi:hypothetical protein